jgi:hypothetical protein
LRDFTIDIFRDLLAAIKRNGYTIITYQQHAENKAPTGKYVILRHDIDAKPLNALHIASLENSLSIKGTYYIRNTPEVYKKEIILQIAAMGHEIGYHYEDLSICKGDRIAAFKSFEKSLSEIRSIYPVKTICMHGSPLSLFDNKQLWQNNNFKEYGILAELYLNTNFDEIFYLTDASRNWNSRFNIRDKVISVFTIPVKNTRHLIKLFDNGSLPEKIMINVHPQRWTNNYLTWIIEMTMQNVKNVFKFFLVKTGVYK